MAFTNLPVQLTSFIGRERDLAELERLLSTARLVTLTGAGGCGKTRLALQVANRVSDSYIDGVWLVELASLRDASLLLPLITQTLRIPRNPEQPIVESLLNHVQSKEMLLVLDNCEHLISDCTQLVVQLLSQTCELRILATSRGPLAIAGETLYPLSGLTWPSADAELAGSPQDLMQYDAVRLFVERARAILPSFNLTTANASGIVQICRRLDGLPLALELASAGSNVLSPQQIAQRLDDRFTLMTSRQRSESDPRHRTLHAAMDWSYDLLSTQEQVLLRRLSVFAGGCSMASAEAVCAGDGIEGDHILELLSSLVDKSLVVAQTLQRREARYSLLETIRHYAQEKLVDSDDWPVARDRHLQYLLTMAEETAPKLVERYQQLWLDWLEDEYGNIRTALDWSLQSDRVEAGLRMANALVEFWQKRGYEQEGLDWFERLSEQADERVSRIVRVKALSYAAYLAMLLGNSGATVEYGQKAGTLVQVTEEAEKSNIGFALAGLANSLRAAEDFQTAFGVGERSIQLLRESGDAYQLGRVLIMQAGTAMALGNYEAVHALLDEGLKLAREAGDTYRIALTLNFSGDLARCEQDYNGAKVNYENSIELFRELDARRDLASALHNLGHACLHLGEVERAHALFMESLALQQAQQNTPGMAECLIGFAAVAIVHNLPAAGARLLSAAMALGGERPANVWKATRMEYEGYHAMARNQLTETKLQAEQAAGHALSMEQAIEYAHRLPLKAARVSWKMPEDLTAREREIAILIAQGKSNGEIAAELVVSKRTVEKHIANILSKLGVKGRTQIVSWVIQSGLSKVTE
jgi:non-specific serine/threonine protein kinase